MIEFLKELLVVNSYTYNWGEINKVADRLSEEFKGLGFAVLKHTSEKSATCLEAFNNKDGEILLIGHTDMAQSLTGAESYDSINGRIVYPGVSDMKGGLVTLVYSLRVLRKLGLLPENLKIVLSCDEEQASPFSKEYLISNALSAKICLSLEPARANGAIVMARKGGVYFTLSAEGRSAHSGVEPEKGISAAEELAHKVIELHKLTKLDQGITVNVGYLTAGSTLGNAVAGSGCAKIDAKFWTSEQGKEVVERIKEICRKPVVPGVRLTLEQHSGFDPMEYFDQTQFIIDEVVNNARKMGLEIDAVITGGEGDAGFITASGTPTVCGMGPVGGLLHSPQEYLEIESLWERTALLSLSIVSLNERLKRNG
jgi:glutamate carboxypeptidase